MSDEVQANAQPQEDEITPEALEAWAVDPANRERARAFGMRLMSYATKPSELAGLESLGEFEDRATAWAIAHQIQARLLVMKLLPKLL